MGELFVFLFFGLVAVNGSYYVQLEELDALPFWLSISVGLLSTAILVVNNIRDLETDRRAGKRTLAVRLGRERTRVLYETFVGGAFLVLAVGLVAADGPLLALIGVFAAPLAIAPLNAVLTRTDGPSLNSALAGTGALLAAFSVLVSVGLLIAA
jgi:1,4-dihydroxy-2-naphthoate octaprenyltransferase